MSGTSLQSSLARLRRRMIAIGAGAGVNWGVVLAAGVLMACMWLDLLLDLPAQMRLLGGAVALLSGAALLVVMLYGVTARTRASRLARRLDEVGQTGGQILSGVDLMGQGDAASEPITTGLAQLAVRRAATLAEKIKRAQAAPAGVLRWPVAVLVAIAVAVAVVVRLAPDLAATQWARFVDPYGDHPPYSRLTLAVDPGDAKVVYGSALDIRAVASGEAADNVEVVWRGGESTDGSAGHEEVLPMFPETGGRWRATLASVTRPGVYYLRSGSARTRHFNVQVITVPRVQEARFRITPPGYTNRPAYEGPLPQGGLAGLPGTRVEMWITSNRPLASGVLSFDAARSQPAGVEPTTREAATRPAEALAVPLATSGAGSSEVNGSFVIASAGKISVKLTDVAGQDSTEAYTAPVTVLPDARPFVRIQEPQPFSLATPNVTLQVQVQAEDDYGIARLQLFRQLNESRYRAMEIALPSPAPARHTAVVPLKLSEYGLNPGDVVKIFARVQDTDPMEPKGSESSVTIIQIITQEEMDQLQVAREGLDVLNAKYEQANRRLEAMIEEVKKLEQELEKLNPDSELAKDKRTQLDELGKRLDAEADAVEKAADQQLPFDMDRMLNASLGEVAKSMRDAAEATRQLSGVPALKAGEAKDELENIRKALAKEREEYDKETMDPLDDMSKVFAVKEAEGEFAELYQRQRDLANRMEALKDTDGANDPATKVRMRDLEEEQKQARQDLGALLDKIETKATELPEEEQFEELRKTAKEFAQDVRSSGAADEMTKAETGLAGFKGAPAFAGADEAANILESFLKKSEKMGEKAGSSLQFSPQMMEAMNSTIQSLLEAEGLGGMGGGAAGYSARRNSLRNVGLYGVRPLKSQWSNSGFGRSNPGVTAPPHGSASDQGETPDGDQQRASGGSGAAQQAVPPQYKRRVGAYFQRVADELGDK